MAPIDAIGVIGFLLFLAGKATLKVWPHEEGIGTFMKWSGGILFGIWLGLRLLLSVIPADVARHP